MVRQRSANPLFHGLNLGVASRIFANANFYLYNAYFYGIMKKELGDKRYSKKIYTGEENGCII